jgi:hypothetical protein
MCSSLWRSSTCLSVELLVIGVPGLDDDGDSELFSGAVPGSPDVGMNLSLTGDQGGESASSWCLAFPINPSNSPFVSFPNRWRKPFALVPLSRADSFRFNPPYEDEVDRCTDIAALGGTGGASASRGTRNVSNSSSSRCMA